MPAATTARIPLTCSASATRYTRNGAISSYSACDVTSSRPRSSSSLMTADTTAPSAAPTAMPPTNSTRNVPAALASEKDPVTAAATANWNATTPDASFMSDSPERSVVCRSLRLTEDFSAVTAAASVGPRAPPRANAAARGMLGTSQCNT